MVSIRDGTTDDSDELWSIRKRAVQAIDTDHYTDEQLDAWSRRGDLPDFPYEEPDQSIPVATQQGEVVGFGGVDLSDGEIRALYVDPDFEVHVGSTLLEHMESTIRDAGYDRIVLDASLNSVPFYHQYDYTRDEVVMHENHGVELEFVAMSKTVGSDDF